MNAAAPTMPQFHPARAFAYIGLGCGALILYTISSLAGGLAARVPALGIPIAVFLLSQLVITGTRFTSDQVICPKNWMLFLFAVQLLAIPLVALIAGFARGQLTHLPAEAAINAALLLQSLAYVSCMTGFILAMRWNRSARRAASTAAHLVALEQRAGTPRALIVVTAVVGIVGLFLRFPSLSDVAGYFNGTSPIAYDLTSGAGVSATTAESLSAFLLPFLGIAFALVGCRAIEQARQRGLVGARVAVTAVVVLIGLAAAYSLYNYNRGTFVMPILAMLATFSMRLVRLRAAAVGAAATVVMLAILAVGSFRTVYFLSQAGVSDIQVASPSLTDTLQVYGQGPQFLGYLLESTPSTAVPMWGTTLVASALSPVPVLGKDFRASSATALYNDLIYGSTVANDQIVPFEGELFWNFDIPGVVVGFLCLGLAVGALDRAARRVRQPLGCFAANYVGFYVAYMVVASVSILSQEFIYFVVPLLVVLIGTERLQRRQMAPAQVSQARPGG